VREDALVRGAILSSYITYDVSHQVRRLAHSPAALCRAPAAAVTHPPRPHQLVVVQNLVLAPLAPP
jgi:hypothetical protein